jgi:hypothetical protein
MKTLWEVKFEGRTTTIVLSASTFLEAVEQAKAISEKIVSVSYLAY